MEEKEPITRLVPVITGAISFDQDNIKFKLELDDRSADHSYDVIARMRDNPRVGQSGVFTARGTIETGSSITLTLPRGLISGERFQYQLGVEFIKAERPFFGRLG